MPEDRLLTFEHLLATDSTETIDFTGLISEDLTFTGSFDIRRGRVKAFGKLLNALPLPVFLLDRASSIEFANSACAKIHPGYVQIRGRQFWTMVPHREERDRVKGIVEEVFDTRKPRIFEATLQIRDKTISGRMHLRSLRVEGERCLIVLVEDLTHEKTKLRENLRLQEELERRVAERTAELTVANKKLKKEVADRTHAEKELLKARQELERRVLERTAELEKSNERLVDEISQRMEAEKASEQLEDRFRTVFQHSLDAIWWPTPWTV